MPMLFDGVQISGGMNFEGAPAVTSDPYFYYNSLLLPGNGTNNGTNNTFVDGSTNNFTITRNDNTTQGTFSPFSLTGWSNYFDGSGDYLTTPSNTAFGFGTGDFTIELWYYHVSRASGDTMFALASDNLSLYINTSGVLGYWNGSVNNSSQTVPLNTWNHIAFVRSGSTAKIYFNGVEVFSGSNSINYATTSVIIGNNPSTDYSHGYISNLRVLKGTALYTSTFTPPTTQLTAISNTSLLTCQSNRFIDNSTNNFTISVNGNTSIQSFSPFNPTSAYSTANVGGSGYFDGTGDYLTVADNAALQMGSGDFTIEFWMQPTSTGVATVFGKGFTGSGAILMQTLSTSGRIELWVNGSLVITESSGTYSPNNWYHIAVVRSGTSLVLYRNGVSTGSVTNSVNLNSTASLGIGGDPTNLGYTFTGYISNFRMVKGSAVYTSAFTPPTAPLTNIANTSLLTNFTNAGITDATGKNVLETVGDAKISTAQSKFGGSSMYFDGTGDYLVTPSSTINSLEGDFTVEMWIYRSAGNNFFFTLGDSFGASGFDLYIGNTGANLRLYSGNSVVIDAALSGINFSTSTWTHVALVRFSGSVKLYVNGIQAGSAWSSSTAFSGRVYVGAEFYNGSITGTCNGYIDDLRVTKGIARYTSNFTSPTEAFPVQ